MPRLNLSYAFYGFILKFSILYYPLSYCRTRRRRAGKIGSQCSGFRGPVGAGVLAVVTGLSRLSCRVARDKVRRECSANGTADLPPAPLPLTQTHRHAHAHTPRSVRTGISSPACRADGAGHRCTLIHTPTTRIPTVRTEVSCCLPMPAAMVGCGCPPACTPHWCLAGGAAPTRSSTRSFEA